MSSEGPVLVLNAGSSSLKYQLPVPETGEVLAKGLVERIGEPGGAADHTAAMSEMSTALADAASTWPRPGCARSATGSSMAARTSPTR